MSYRAALLRRVMMRLRVERRVRSPGLQVSTLAIHHGRHVSWKPNLCRWLSASVGDDVSWENSEEPRGDDESDMAAERDRMLGEICKSLHKYVKRMLIETPDVKKKWERILRRRRRERQRQASFSAKSSGDDQSGEPFASIAPHSILVDNLATQETHSSNTTPETSSKDTIHKAEVDGQNVVSSWDDDSSFGALGTDVEQRVTETTIDPIQEDIRDEDKSLLDILRQPIEEETFVTQDLNFAAKDSTDDEPSSSQPVSLLSLLNEEFNSEGTSTLSQLVPESTQSSSLMDLLSDEADETSLGSKEKAGEDSSLLGLLQRPIEDESLSTNDTAVNWLRSGEMDRELSPENEVADTKSSSLSDLLQRPIEEEVDEPAENLDGFKGNEPQSLLDLLNEPSENERLKEVVEEGLALLLALRGRDWSLMEGAAHETEESDSPQVDETEELDSFQEDDGIIEESVIDGGVVAEVFEVEPVDEKEEEIHDGGSSIRVDDAILDNITKLLEEMDDVGTTLSTTDYNALLLHIGTSSLQTDDTIALMFRAYRQMTELGQACAACAPDATTFTILMVTLDRRAKAPMTAVDICRQMMDSAVDLSSDALAQGITCLERRNGIRDMERLIDSVLNNEGRVDVPTWAWLSLLKMYKNEDMQGEALDLLEKCIKINGEQDERTATKVVLEAMSWPRRDRGGGELDRSSFLSKVLHLLESCGNRDSTPQENEFLCHYSPSYDVWKRLVLSLASEVDRETGSGWPIVHKAFESMQNSVEHYWPDSSLLKTGLKVSEVTGDAELAVDLVLRVHNKRMGDQERFESSSYSSAQSNPVESTSLWSDDGVDADVDQSVIKADLFGSSVFWSDIDTIQDGDRRTSPSEQTNPSESTSPSEESSIAPTVFGGATVPWENDVPPTSNERKSVRVPLQAFISSMRLCVATGDMSSAEKLLGCIRDSRNVIPTTMKKDLFTLALKGYAKVGNSDEARALLKEMQDDNVLNPTEEAYGTVILSLAVAKKTEEACELFEAMNSGQFGDDIYPGVSCYNARMLAHVEAHQWDEALACHARRKEAGLPYSAASFQDVLLASYRMGHKAKALEAIKEALESEMKMDHRCCDLSLQLLLGDVLKSKTFEQARHRLREIGEQNQNLKKPALNLSRSLRTAEMEEKRKPIKSLKGYEIAAKREHAWRNALEDLVEFTRSIEKTEDLK